MTTPKCFVYVGNWSFSARPEKGKGITIFRYEEETGELTLLKTVCPDVAAGQLYLDAPRLRLYSNDECGERRGEIGGGGYVLAFEIDPQTGDLRELSRQESLCPEPSYLCLDREGRYLLACHCADPWHVTRILRRADGTYGNEVLFDDTALIALRVLDDGSLGEICDVSITPGAGGIGELSQVNADPVSGHIQLVRVISRLHSVTLSPSGALLVVCDKGMDRVYTYRLDRAHGRLLRLSVWQAPEIACFPRYAAFHPQLNALYVNNENVALLNAFHYNEASGALERFHSVYLLPRDPGPVQGKPVGAQDLLMHPTGAMLYVTLCGLNLIVSCRLDAQGTPFPCQWTPARGDLPRGLALSPDGRFLLCGNMVSGDVTVFAVSPDGLLTDTGRTYPAVSPSALRFARWDTSDA